MSEWTSVKDRLPEKDGRYLTILESKAKAQHAKTWGGIGQPEFTTFCDEWHFKWNARGSLSVAYWMEPPEFNMKWVKNLDGEEGCWMPPLEPPKDNVDG
jgi:hypothetical protein